ncbi:MAG: C4-type zinc ribbon domain-containing protein [Nitrospira sp.]|nr:C4-type zinc ribbon domain-containing protein [Nitrospira sp.]
MDHRFSPLLELQKLDLRMMGIQAACQKIPERLRAAEAPLREAIKRLQDAKAAMDAAAKERRSYERDLEAHEAHMERMKAHAAHLKTNKEYQAHLFELDLANKKRGELEEKVLLCMERIDQLQQVVTEAQRRVAALEESFGQEQRALVEEERTLATELAQVKMLYQEVARKVEPNLLQRYNQIKASCKEPPLAAVRDSLCLGCRLQIPPQLVAQVKRSEELLVCPYCHRILYWEGEPQPDGSGGPARTSSSIDGGGRGRAS